MGNLNLNCFSAISFKCSSCGGGVFIPDCWVGSLSRRMHSCILAPRSSILAPPCTNKSFGMVCKIASPKQLLVQARIVEQRGMTNMRPEKHPLTSWNTPGSDRENSAAPSSAGETLLALVSFLGLDKFSIFFFFLQEVTEPQICPHCLTTSFCLVLRNFAMHRKINTSDSVCKVSVCNGFFCCCFCCCFFEILIQKTHLKKMDSVCKGLYSSVNRFHNKLAEFLVSLYVLSLCAGVGSWSFVAVL